MKVDATVTNIPSPIEDIIIKKITELLEEKFNSGCKSENIRKYNDAKGISCEFMLAVTVSQF